MRVVSSASSANATVNIQPGLSERRLRRRNPSWGSRVAEGIAWWYIVVVYPTGPLDRGGREQSDQSHRRARRILRERAQALQEAVREGRALVRIQEASALREAQREAQAQSAGGSQKGQAARAVLRLAPAPLRPARRRTRRRARRSPSGGRTIGDGWRQGGSGDGASSGTRFEGSSATRPGPTWAGSGLESSSPWSSSPRSKPRSR